MADGFAADAVLMRREIVRHIIGLQDLIEWGGSGGVVSLTNGEGDVLETERV
jgi:hypothetical protein